ncbi:hypothetical protein [Lysobacter sp. HA18]
MRDPVIYMEDHEFDAWPKPHLPSIKPAWQQRYINGHDALKAVLGGTATITRAAENHHLCRKRLKEMVRRAPKMAPDGLPYGFRACVPYGAYCQTQAANDDAEPAEMPKTGGPHAMAQLLAAQPTIAIMVEAFTTPVPPGRPPKAFDKLHTKIVNELTRQDLGEFYPLNQPDEGRQALMRFIRRRRIDGAPAGDLDVVEPAATFEEMFTSGLFARAEVDAHRIDIEDQELAIQMPNGAIAKHAVTTLWVLIEVERQSRAVTGWSLRCGGSYNNFDLCICIARSLRNWARRDLTIPGLQYAPGAGMPSGLLGERSTLRVRSLALDNAIAHSAQAFVQAFCRAHGGMLFAHRAHEPRSRPIIEQLFSRLERGAFRKLPGGFEPATRLGENRLRISNTSGKAQPILLSAFEELIEVLVANYNATPHPSLGGMSPIEYLQMQSTKAWDFMPDTGNDDADDMASSLVRLQVHGNRADGVMPHVNYKYAKYRSPELDQRWELVGKEVLLRVNRHDLRTLVVMRSVTTPMCVVRAAAPWNRTPHDETTRQLIMQWSKLRKKFSLVGVDCAIAAYVEFLRRHASEDARCVDELGRLEQQDRDALSHGLKLEDMPAKIPASGWCSLDDDDEF